MLEANTAGDFGVSSVIYKHAECSLDLLLLEGTFIAFSSAFGLQKIPVPLATIYFFYFKKNQKTTMSWKDGRDNVVFNLSQTSDSY